MHKFQKTYIQPEVDTVPIVPTFRFSSPLEDILSSVFSFGWWILDGIYMDIPKIGPTKMQNKRVATKHQHPRICCLTGW